MVDKQTIRVLVVSFYELFMLKMKHTYKKTEAAGCMPAKQMCSLGTITHEETKAHTTGDKAP